MTRHSFLQKYPGQVVANSSTSAIVTIREEKNMDINRKLNKNCVAEAFMSDIWVTVADSSRARIFKADSPTAPLEEIQTLAHPEARLHEGDLTTDRSGRDTNSTSGSHGFGSETETKDEEASRFASFVCNTLDVNQRKGSFNKLYIVAAPAFLGLLRKHRSNNVKQVVAEELSKNLCTMDVKTIRSHLPEYL
jgi:protein required for attachment to host cells